MLVMHPMKLPGRWRAGYALDYHTISSSYVGDDEFGHPRFDTRRSEIGEQLYRLKNRFDKSGISPLVEVATSFLREWKPAIDAVVPVPPSAARAVQPVIVLAEPIVQNLGIELARDWIAKTRDVPQLKNVYDYGERMRLLEGAYAANRERTAGKRILLFDDLFRSGATLNEMTAVLYDQGMAAEVFVLTVTRTRSMR